ncbi:MAG: prepilin-type N-terminal cleavage/methylation domain-containing protein [Syntrophothermus sp.]|nr:prepilin-type N-terminal cleavage/methylation domain-containing protein [Syntrophothermus sp.]
MMARKRRGGFTLIEVLIAVGVLVAVLTVMAGMVKVAYELLADSYRELQRAYTERSVLEIAAVLAASGTLSPQESEVWVYPLKIREEGVEKDLLLYEGPEPKEWKAKIKYEGNRLSAQICGRNDEDDY